MQVRNLLERGMIGWHYYQFISYRVSPLQTRFLRRWLSTGSFVSAKGPKSISARAGPILKVPKFQIKGTAPLLISRYHGLQKILWKRPSCDDFWPDLQGGFGENSTIKADYLKIIANSIAWSTKGTLACDTPMAFSPRADSTDVALRNIAKEDIRTLISCLRTTLESSSKDVPCQRQSAR